MRKKIISILCEGPHDAAFIFRILKTDNFQSIDKWKLGAYPEPISSFLIGEVTKANVKELNIQEVKHSFIPSYSLQKGDSFIFLYSVGGIDKHEIRKRYLGKLFSFIPQENEIDPFSEFDLGLIYFFDADQAGIMTRISSLNDEIESIIGEKAFAKNGDIKEFGKLNLGCFIFSEKDDNYGKLEDIMLPIMKSQNEKIFENADKYLKEHLEKTRCKGNYDHAKSLIGLCGQLQKSGASNVVCISQTDYITEEKIAIDEVCKRITEFVNSFVVDNIDPSGSVN